MTTIAGRQQVQLRDFVKRIIALGVCFLLAGIMGFAVLGCAHRESRRSRDLLECVYDAQYGPGLTPAERNKAVEACK